MSAQYNKFIMIDRIFFTNQNQLPNPYGHMATEYDVTTDTFRDLSSGIVSNSWCSAVRLLLPGRCQACVDAHSAQVLHWARLLPACTAGAGSALPVTQHVFNVVAAAHQHLFALLSASRMHSACGIAAARLRVQLGCRAKSCPAAAWSTLVAEGTKRIQTRLGEGTASAS